MARYQERPAALGMPVPDHLSRRVLDPGQVGYYKTTGKGLWRRNRTEVSLK